MPVFTIWPHLAQGRWRYVGFILGCCVPSYTVLVGLLWDWGKGRTNIERPLAVVPGSFCHLANSKSSLPGAWKSSVMLQFMHSPGILIMSQDKSELAYEQSWIVTRLVGLQLVPTTLFSVARDERHWALGLRRPSAVWHDFYISVEERDQLS